jgi:hypothetical protein
VYIVGLLLLIRAGLLVFLLHGVGGDVVASKNVSVTKKVGFVSGDVLSSCDSDGVVSVNTGGITSFSAGVDGDGTVVADTGVSVVNKSRLRLLVVIFVRLTVLFLLKRAGILVFLFVFMRAILWL